MSSAQQRGWGESIPIATAKTHSFIDAFFLK